MGAEYNFFGHRIVQLGSNYYVGFINGTDKRVTGESLSDVKDKITEYLRKLDKEELYEKIDNAFNCNSDTFNFFYNMIVSFHTCEGAAVQNMQDYCSRKNI